MPIISAEILKIIDGRERCEIPGVLKWDEVVTECN